MTIIRDIHDIFRDAKSAASDGKFKLNTKGSVAAEARKGILQFPVLCSASLSLEEATMMGKALEREFVSFIRVITSIDSVTDSKDVKAFIRGLHQNMPNQSVSSVFNESATVKPRFKLPKMDVQTHNAAAQLDREFHSMLMEATKDEDELDVVTTDEYDSEEDPSIDELLAEFYTENPNRNVYKMQGFSGMVLHEGTKLQGAFMLRNQTNGTYQYVLTPPVDVKNMKEINREKIIQECTVMNRDQLKEYTPWFREDALNDKTRKQNYSVMSESATLKNRYNTYGKRILSEDGHTFDEDTPTQALMGRNTTATSSYDIVPKDNLSDNDAKKANEMVPTMLHIKTYFRNELGDLEAVDYMVGVKTIIHTIKSESIEQNLVRGVNRGNAIFNFLRWTTGETEFFKDFVFAINNIRQDVNGKFSDSRWWTVLRRRSKRSSLLRKLNSKNQLLPNSTIVITMDEVHKMRNEHSVDLMSTTTVRKLMNEYFLISFVVADTASEIAYFMYDGESDFQQYSYTSLERENSNQAREVKNIMQILGKM